MKGLKKSVAVLMAVLLIFSPVFSSVAVTGGMPDEPILINIGTVSATGDGYTFSNNVLTI